MVIGLPSICVWGAQVLSRLSAFFPPQLGRLHGLSLREDVFQAKGAKSRRTPAATLVVDYSTHLSLARGTVLEIIQWDLR